MLDINIGKQSLLVVGEGILKAGNEFSSEIKSCIDFLINSSNEDLINGTLDVVKGLYYLIRTSPITLDYMFDKMQTPGKYEKVFPNYLDYCISKIHYGDQNKQFPSYKEWKPLAEKQFEELEKERTENWEKLKAKPRQFTVDTVSELTKLFLYCGLGEAAAFKIGRLAKNLSNVMLDEAMLLAKKIDSLKAAANGIYDVEAIKTPLLNSIKMTEDAICNTVKYGEGNVTKGLAVIKNNLEILRQEGKTVIEVVQEVGNQFKTNLQQGQGYRAPEPHTSTPVGRKGDEVKIGKVNREAVIKGRKYCDHTIDRLRERGLTPEVVENTIKHSTISCCDMKRPGRLNYYDSVNNISVVVEKGTGEVVTLTYGKTRSVIEFMKKHNS